MFTEIQLSEWQYDGFIRCSNGSRRLRISAAAKTQDDEHLERSGRIRRRRRSLIAADSQSVSQSVLVSSPFQNS
jgi:hypothetical protein